MSLPRVISRTRVWLLIRLVANAVAQSGTTVATALLIKLTFDRFITHAHADPLSADRLAWVALGLLAAAVCAAWLRMAERTDAERLGQDYVHQVRIALYRHMSMLTPRVLQRRSRGSIVLRFVGDLTALRQWVSLGLARLVVAAITIFATLLALAILNWVLALTVGLVIAAGAAASIVLGKSMAKAVREARRRRTHLAANLNEKVASMAVVQVFGQTRRERHRVRRQSHRLKTAMVSRARIIGGLRALAEGTTAIATGGALLLGAIEVGTGRVTPGTVVAAMSIVGLLVPSLRDLGRVHEYWHGARVSGEQIRKFLDTPPQVVAPPQAAALNADSGRLEFRDVSAAGSLTDFTGTAEPGSVVAIVGPNGAGKSTLLSLAVRLVDPSKGTVMLDGQDIAAVAPNSLRRIAGMVSADLPLLRGSIEKNLRYRWRDAPEEEVARVSALCGVDEVLAELPEAEKTRLTEGGGNLSLGQRQRIALARAILGNPKILLLDEADANLDPKASAAFSRVFSEYQGTVLLATHQLEKVAAADTVWYLEDGRLVEVGAPLDLLNADGATARLFGRAKALAS